LGAEVAGNTLWAMSRLFNRTEYVVDDPDPRFVSTYYRIFDTRFAQYIKADIDYRRGVRLNETHSIACRSFVGIGLPYGTYNVIPFERRYFTGGSNGIRAWQVRSLGPGSYTGGATEYPNQSSDIKLEANLEYRFKLIWMFEGALFLDGGNIWAINRKDNREGVVFRFDTFYKEFALGTGFGLRIVAPFFIVRADLGLKLRDPALPEGNRWIPAERKFQRSDIALNIAVGYPF
jgi:outer membrane protein assembly factor BamA